MISTLAKLFRNGAWSRDGETIPMTKHLFRAAMIAGTALSLLTAAGPASADLVYDWTLSGTDTGSGTLTAGAPDGSGFDITALTGTIDGDPIDGLLGSPLELGGLPSPHSARSFTTTSCIRGPLRFLTRGASCSRFRAQKATFGATAVPTTTRTTSVVTPWQMTK